MFSGPRWTTWAAIRQLAPVGYWGVAYETLAGVDDFYIAGAATGSHPAAGCGWLLGGGEQEARWRGRPLQCTDRHPEACCGRLLNGRLVGVDDPYMARTAILQPSVAGCWCVVHWKLVGVDDLYESM